MRFGLDRLLEEPALRKPLAGRRIALLAHPASVTRNLAHALDALARADLTALSDYLGERPYFMGQDPTSLDAAAYAWLAHILWVPFQGPVKDYAASLPNLVAYCQRMKEQYYPEGG